MVLVRRCLPRRLRGSPGLALGSGRCANACVAWVWRAVAAQPVEAAASVRVGAEVAAEAALRRRERLRRFRGPAALGRVLWQMGQVEWSRSLGLGHLDRGC